MRSSRSFLRANWRSARFIVAMVASIVLVMALSIGTAWAANSDAESDSTEQATDSQTTAPAESADEASTTDDAPAADEPVAPADEPAAPATEPEAPAAAKAEVPAQSEAPVAAEVEAPTTKSVKEALKAPSENKPGDEVGHQPVTFCHASGFGNGKKPYGPKPLTTDANSVIKQGHDGHTGPAWSEGATTWGDIIPEFDYTDKDGNEQHYPGSDAWNTDEGKAILANGCQAPGETVPPEVTPAEPDHTDAVCNAETGELSAPTLSVPAVEGISYEWNETDVVNGGTVVITATADDDHALKAGNGWEVSEDGTSATITVTFENIDCATPLTKVTPVNPDVIQAECDADTGINSEPSVTVKNTDDITYTINGEVKAGNTVTVTATATDGNELDLTGLTAWTSNDDGTATYTVNLEDPDCVTPPTKAVPQAPGVIQADCVPGTDVVSDPTVTLAETAGIEYSINGEVKAGNEVTITATAKDGFTLGSAEGWNFSDDGHTATIKITLDAAPDCSTPPVDVLVTPQAPAVDNSVCVDDEATEAALNLATTEGIDYTVDGEVKAGSTVTVIATPTEGHSLTAAEGWTLQDDGSATYPVTFTDAAECTTTPPTTEPPTEPTDESTDSPKTDEPVAEGNLPRTGVDNGLWMLLIGGGALIAAGAATIIASRKKA